MKKVAVVYSFNTTNSKLVAKKIKEALGKNTEEINAEDLSGKVMEKFENFVFVTPTWFDGELPNYYDEFMPELEELDLKDKIFAVAGLGDQVEYPENFIDAVGHLADAFEERGGKVIGHTSTKGFNYESSSAIRNNKFCGLAIDIENMSDKIDTQIEKWVEQLKKDFN